MLSILAKIFFTSPAESYSPSLILVIPCVGKQGDDAAHWHNSLWYQAGMQRGLGPPCSIMLVCAFVPLHIHIGFVKSAAVACPVALLIVT